jgi:dGTPase
VAESVTQYRAIHEAVAEEFPEATDRERFYEALRRLIDALVSGLIEGAVEAAARAQVRDAEDVRACPHRIAAFTEETAAASRELKRFLHARVYGSADLNEGRRRSMGMIAALFESFLKVPSRLPHPYAARIGPEPEPPHRVICDYIAGMTDAFCQRTWEQITD